MPKWLFLNKTHFVGRQDTDDSRDVASDIDVTFKRSYQHSQHSGTIQGDEFRLKKYS